MLITDVALLQVSGLYFLSKKKHTPMPVPLQGVHVSAKIVDFACDVTVQQHYYNAESVPIEATFVFPLDSNAAVYGLEVNIDDHVSIAHVAEKEEARATYDRALAQGKGAQLLEQVRNDVFQMKVGNLGPGQHALITIKYISDLKIEGDDVRFVLPTAICPRYHPISERNPVPQGGSLARTRDGLSFDVDCFMLHPITQLHCPSHALKVSHNPGEMHAHAELAADTTHLEKELVLLVRSASPHEPRVCVETDAAGNRVAMITIAPQFELDEHKAEIVFVVDRSGSMGGQKIEQASRSLALFLRSLPVDCYFNIVGFGSRYQALWPAPRKNGQAPLAEATAYASSMRADFGGTELMAPLREIFKKQPHKGYKRQVIVLTDGAVSNTSEVTRFVASNAGTSRVFALGLGDDVSHELVDSIARAGHGTAEYATTGERLEGKVIRQLRDAMQPSLTDVTVDWDMASATAPRPTAPEATATTSSSVASGAYEAVAGSAIGSLLGFKSASKTAREVVAPKTPVQQVPRDIPPIFSQSRFMLFYWMDDADSNPTQVTIKAKTPLGPLAVALPIQERDCIQGDILHRLAARARIRELEAFDSTSQATPFRNRVESGINKRDIVAVALKYNLASKYTSFVSVTPAAETFYGCPAAHVVVPPASKFGFSCAATTATSTAGPWGGSCFGGSARFGSDPHLPATTTAPWGAPSRKPAAGLAAFGSAPVTNSFGSAPAASSAFGAPFAHYSQQSAPSGYGSVSSGFGGGGFAYAKSAAAPRMSSAGGRGGRGGGHAMLKKKSAARSRKCESNSYAAAPAAAAMSMTLCDSFAFGGSMDDESDCDDDMGGALFDCEESMSNEICDLSAAPPPAAAPVPSSAPMPTNMSHSERTLQLAMLQNFDGSFEPTPQLATLLRCTISDLKGAPAGLSAKAWVAIAVAEYFRLMLADCEDEWMLVAQKAESWFMANGGSSDFKSQAQAFVWANCSA